jgi:hypothetical protein
MNFLKNVFTNKKRDPIIVVSGLPRSGTSMMMSMLNAGGLEVVTDNLRIADENNPKGYFELERVKKLKDGDNQWLEAASGKTVKIISALIKYLPEHYSYKIIFMSRNINEVLKSQRRMLERDGKSGDDVDDQIMANLFHQHLDDVSEWLKTQKNIQVLRIHYNDILKEPESHVEKIDIFLGIDLDKEAMMRVVEPKLYRERIK